MKQYIIASVLTIPASVLAIPTNTQTQATIDKELNNLNLGNPISQTVTTRYVKPVKPLIKNDKKSVQRYIAIPTKWTKNSR